MTFWGQIKYDYGTDRGNPGEYGGKCQKGEPMEDEMSVSELRKEVVEENQTRKILEILNECETLEEAREKVRALLNK